MGGGAGKPIFSDACVHGGDKKKKVGLYCHLLAAHTSLLAHPIGQVKENNVVGGGGGVTIRLKFISNTVHFIRIRYRNVFLTFY